MTAPLSAAQSHRSPPPNMSRRPRDEHHRFFTVSEPRAHEKGHTEYKVTARFVSKREPEDVKEVVVWRRFSELRRLHGELSYTHRNLFRRQEEFPPFPRAQVFGRFDEAVIEERRKAAEAMLQFATAIPALYNSPQLKEFFTGGEVTRPSEPALSSHEALPPPLIPLPGRRASDCEPVEEEEGREAPALPRHLGADPEAGEPEVAVEAYGAMGEPEQDLSDPEPETAAPPDPPPANDRRSPPPRDEFESLFDAVAEEPAPSPEGEVPPALSDTDLAVFDPCYARDRAGSAGDHEELFSLLPPPGADGGAAEYLGQAAAELKGAMEREEEGEFGAAIRGYRAAVDILITGVQGDPDPTRRESVVRRTDQYLKHAEMLVDRHLSPTHTPANTHTQGP